MNRRTLALVAVVALVVLSGCSAFGSGGEVDKEDLLGDADYQWESNATATYNLSVSSSSYTAVLKIRNQSTLDVHSRSAFRGDQSVSVEALRFRFENGTVVNATHPGLTASEGSDETEIGLPARNGTVAWTADRSGKSWSTPIFVEGSHQVEMPESARAGIPLLSRVTPGTDRRTVEDDQMILYWEESSSSISIRYYLVRDLYLFGSIAVIALLLGLGGTVYYLRQIRAAKKKREEVGFDIDYDDDDVGGDGPPPGMR